MFCEQGISPRVRGLVRWLNTNGFKTTDSGDGSNYAAGMECAVPFPMVAIRVQPCEQLVYETNRLYKLLKEEYGLVFGEHEEGPRIEASYNPSDMTAVILLLNVTDDLVEEFS